MRKGKIEFRFGRKDEMHELVSWHDGEKSCHVIAFFEKTKEGHDMRTVGDRFFEDKDSWIVAKFAVEFLNKSLELYDEETK